MFRIAEAIHLPSDKAHLGLCIIDNDLKVEPIGEAEYSSAEYQYIYITTKDPVNTGDWFYDEESNRVLKCTDGDLKNSVLAEETKTAYGRGSVRKVVSSTDSSLGLPLPTDNFIQKYVNNGGRLTNIKIFYALDVNSKFNRYKPLLDDNNRAIIKTDKLKYTTDEVMDLLHAYREFAWKNGMTKKELITWMNLNL